MKELTGYTLSAADGEIGSCVDFLFDDRRWVVRYMVADTGTWLPGRKVVIAPYFLGDPDWPAKRVTVRLTRKQIERSPELAENQPVSGRHEAEIAAFYGLRPWWAASAPVGAAWGQPAQQSGGTTAVADEGDPRLRSFDEVEGYRIVATDDDVGHVEDLVVDDRDWSIRYLVIDTRSWLPGKKVLVSPNWLYRFDWSRGTAEVDLTRLQIENSPEYDPAKPIYRAYEARLHEGYGKASYWTTQDREDTNHA